MDATLSGTTTARPGTDQKSRKRPGAGMRFLEISRDGWKRKYQDLKDSIKRLKNRVADLTKSREHWRSKAEQARDQVSVLEAEIASLRVLVAVSAEKKPSRTSTGSRSTRPSSTYPVASSIPWAWCSGWFRG